jgi:hypothetical protein
MVFFRGFIRLRPSDHAYARARVTNESHALDTLLVNASSPPFCANDLFPVWNSRIPMFSIECGPRKTNHSGRDTVRYLHLLIKTCDDRPANLMPVRMDMGFHGIICVLFFVNLKVPGEQMMSIKTEMGTLLTCGSPGDRNVLDWFFSNSSPSESRICSSPTSID